MVLFCFISVFLNASCGQFIRVASITPRKMHDYHNVSGITLKIWVKSIMLGLFTRLTSLWHHDGCRCRGAKLALGHRHRPCWLDCDWFHINHIMWYTHHVTTIKQEMVHTGQQVGNLLICLFWWVRLLTMITFYVSQYQPTTKHDKALSYRK